jgi:acetyl esterase
MLRKLTDLFAPAHAYRGPPLRDCADVGAAPEAIEGAETYIYREVGARALRLHVFGAARNAPRPALLYFFGGAFRGGDANEFAAQARLLSEQGYVVVCADYRVLCRDNVTPAAGVADAAAASDWVHANAKTLGVDRRRIVLAGASAGGLAAVVTALCGRHRPAALVLFNPVMDVRDGQFNYGMGRRLSASISPAALALSHLPPTLILHGGADTVVPIASSQNFQARSRAAGRTCDLVTYKGLGHSFFQRRDVIPNLGAAPFDHALKHIFDFLKATLA